MTYEEHEALSRAQAKADRERRFHRKLGARLLAQGAVLDIADPQHCRVRGVLVRDLWDGSYIKE